MTSGSDPSTNHNPAAPAAPARPFVLTEFLPYQLAVASAEISAEFARRYRARFGLSLAEWRILAHLSQDDMVSVRDIHKRAHLEKSKVSRAATKLEKAGLIAKSGSASDRRLVALTLTASGRDMVSRIAPLAHDYEQALIARIGGDDQTLREALAQLSATAHGTKT